MRFLEVSLMFTEMHSKLIMDNKGFIEDSFICDLVYWLSSFAKQNPGSRKTKLSDVYKNARCVNWRLETVFAVYKKQNKTCSCLWKTKLSLIRTKMHAAFIEHLKLPFTKWTQGSLTSLKLSLKFDSNAFGLFKRFSFLSLMFSQVNLISLGLQSGH